MLHKYNLFRIQAFALCSLLAQTQNSGFKSITHNKKTAIQRAADFSFGEGGIRTHGKCYPSQTFEIRTLNHSDTSPEIQRGWDSNPRWNCSHTTFPRLHLKPLGHLSLSIHLYSSALIMPKSIPLFYLNPA